MALKSVRNPDALEKEVENGRILCEAATSGDVQTLEKLLNRGARVDADAYIRTLFYKSQNYLTPLQCAAQNGHADCIAVLIEWEADLDVCDRYDTTAVHMAAERGHLECLRRLLEAGARCNAGTKPGKPGSYSAPYVGQSRPLHLATLNSHTECVKELIMNGADYNATDDLGQTSLYLAAQRGFEECITTHLHNAIGRDILSLPVKDTGETPLHECVRHAMLPAVEALLRHGSDVNHRNKKGDSPLLVACHPAQDNFSFPLVATLVRRGYNTDVNIADNMRLTPLYYVSFSEVKTIRRPEVAAFLIAYGAQFAHLKNKHGTLLLHQELSALFPEECILRAMVRATPRLAPLPPRFLHSPASPERPPGPLRHRPPWERFPRERRHSDKARATLIEWYESVRTSPRTLQHYTRCVIRERLGPRRLRHVPTLPLPRVLNEYLLLDMDFTP